MDAFRKLLDELNPRFMGGADELQGIAGGVEGLLITGCTLVLLQNREIIETYGALRKRLVKEPPAVEATDVA